MLLTRSGPINVGVATLVEKDGFVSDRIRKGDLELLADDIPRTVTQADLKEAGSVEELLKNLAVDVKPGMFDLKPKSKSKTAKKAV
jgi:hypothetical protein